MDQEINGQIYRFGKLDALTQINIVRKLMPVLGAIIPMAKEFSGEDKPSEDPYEQFSKIFPELSKALSGISESDFNTCLLKLLACVYRKEKGDLGYAAVSTGEVLVYQDLDLKTLLQLVWTSLLENFRSFFSVKPSALNPESLKQSVPSSG